MINARLLAGACAAIVMAIVVVVWSRVWLRLWRGKPLLPREPCNPVPWGFLEIALAIGCLAVFSFLASAFVNQRFDVTANTPRTALPVAYWRWSTLALAFASIATLVVVAGAVLVRGRVRFHDLRFVLQTAWRDVKLGGAAFVLLAPPVYALQFLLVRWVDSKHPIIELLKERPDPGLIVISVFSTVIVAPIFEEFLFRGLLQGWLEKLVAHADEPFDLPLGATAVRSYTPAGSVAEDTTEAKDASVIECAVDVASHDTGDSADAFSWGVAWLPVFTSASLFALLHLEHGPDWVPLFFLALGLGYVYRQTHRLLPCITIHFLLNSCSMSMFLVELLRR